MTTPADQPFARRLLDLDARSRRRVRRATTDTGGVAYENGQRILNFAGNDYLDLAHHPTVRRRAREALEAWGAGATASPLLAGYLPCHERLEAELAALKGYPAALLFNCGYSANLGLVGALAGNCGVVLADRLAHASLLDGARLSGLPLHRFRHNDAGHLEVLLRKHGAVGGKPALILTESVFSMDGDRAPLRDLAVPAREHGAVLVVDEAHATGVMGPGGAGLVREAGLHGDVAVSMGTMSKALGAGGGFAACPAVLRDLFINFARSYIYSTALPPPVAGAALGALEVLRQEGDRPDRLAILHRHFRSALNAAGFDTMASDSPIVPVTVGEDARALRIADRLRGEGVRAAAIRPPTVPEGTARLRFSVTLAHSIADLDYAVAVLSRIAREEGAA